MTTRTTFLLTNIVAVFFLTVVATPPVALAQGPAVAACVPEIRTWCAASQGQARQACIKVRFTEFSLDCQLALVKAAALTKACQADVKKNCAGVLPGERRIEACLKDHFANVSDRCKVTISRAASKS